MKKLTLDNAFESIEDEQETAGKSGGGAASQQPLVKTESQDGGGNGGGFGTMKPQQPAAAVATKENGSAENVKVELIFKVNLAYLYLDAVRPSVRLSESVY